MAVKIISKHIFFFIISNLLTIKSSFLNIEELQKSKYLVEISSEPVLLSHQHDNEGAIHLTSKYGQQYQCIIPSLNLDEQGDSLKNITTQEIIDLLQPLNNTCLYSLRNGWWTYKTCFGRSVHQYHDDGTQPIKDDLCLGNFTGQTDWSVMNIEEKPAGNVWYHSQFYTNGTICDLTGGPRSTEIRFFCKEDATDIIERIDEPSTCSYVISVHTNKLCNLSLFRPKTSPKELSINCSPALLQDQYLKYQEMKEQDEDEDVDVDNMLTPKTDNEVDDKGEETEPGTSNIFKTIGKLLSRDKQGSGNNIKWEDVLKESTDEIQGSVEKIRENIKDEDIAVDNMLTSKTANEVNDDREETGPGTSNIFKTIGKLLSQEKQNGDNKIDWENVLKESTDEIQDSVEKTRENIKAAGDEETKSSVKSASEAVKIGNVYENEKEKYDETDKYYKNLIEELKEQYKTFKEEMTNMAKGVRKRVENVESGSEANPVMAKIVKHLRQTVQKFEEKQKALDVEMEKLTDFNKAVMEGGDPASLKTEMANIRKRLYNLMTNINKKDQDVDDSSNADLLDHDTSHNEDDVGVQQNNDVDQNKKYVATGQTKTAKLDQEGDQESIFKREKDKNILEENKELDRSGTIKEHKVFDMENPKLDKVVSKLKKLMTQDAEEMSDDSEDIFNDDNHVSVRVVKMKDKHALEQAEESMFNEEDEVDKMQESEEVMSATRKMESIVRKQLHKAGIKHAGNIRVKVITSSDHLKKVTGNSNGFQILSSDETSEFKTLLTSLLGSSSDFVKEKEKQEKLEDNYNLVWNENGFTSTKDENSNEEVEKEDDNEQIFLFHN